MNKKNRGRKMSDRSHEMGKRYNALRAQGITSREAAKTVNQEFNADVADVTIRTYGAHYKKKFGAIEASPAPDERKGKDTGAAEPPGSVPLSDIDERIRAVVRQVFQEMIHDIDIERRASIETDDVPPEPEVIKGEGKGRRENRDYVKVSVTVDKVLWEKFTKERDRMKVSSGRLMDIILWRAFGRPALSYEMPHDKKE